MTEQADRDVCQIGSTGDRVRLIQTMLSTLGYSLGPIDGVYGKRTARAVRQFQIVWGLERDGVAGPETQAVLFGRFSKEFQVLVEDAAVASRAAELRHDPNDSASHEPAPDTPVAGRPAVESGRELLDDIDLRRWLKSRR